MFPAIAISYLRAVTAFFCLEAVDRDRFSSLSFFIVVPAQNFLELPVPSTRLTGKRLPGFFSDPVTAAGKPGKPSGGYLTARFGLINNK
jgi:hypothetical protein